MALNKNTRPLPLTHPDFRYGESKNIYWKKLKEAAISPFAYGDLETETHRGTWRTRFADAGTATPQSSDSSPSPRRLLHVELGCSAGHVSVEWAARNPSDAYIGIDWKFKIIYWAAEKVVKRGLKNLLFFRAHGDRLHYMFGEGEVDRLYLYFPDPWPKKAQMKNRTFTAEWLRNIYPILAKDGIFHIKTDHPGYFDWMKEAVAQVPQWKVLESTRNLHAAHPNPRELTIPDVTLFERLFIKDGLPIHSMKLGK